ncbi:MAG: nitroreductase family protein [Bacteroidota bacterium]
MDIIFTRRSIRKYTDQTVSDDQIQQMLKAAMYAPSARNEQPWHFIVVQDKQRLTALSEIHPYAKMLTQASLAILVCGDSSIIETEGYWVQDCTAATQTLLLAAHALGLGAVWLGVFPREERIKAMKDFFELPAHIHPLSLISIGYPAEKIEMPDRFKKERIRFEKW